RRAVAESRCRRESAERRADGGRGGGLARAARDERQRAIRKLANGVVNPRLGGLAEWRLLNVGDDADDAEGAAAEEVESERADVPCAGDDALADGVFAGEHVRRERLID